MKRNRAVLKPYKGNFITMLEPGLFVSNDMQTGRRCAASSLHELKMKINLSRKMCV